MSYYYIRQVDICRGIEDICLDIFLNEGPNAVIITAYTSDIR